MRIFEVTVTACALIAASGVLVAVLVGITIRLTDWLENRRDARLAAERFAHHQRKVF